MQQYNVEFFENVTGDNNTHKLTFRHHDVVEDLMIDDDYLAAQTTVIEIGSTDNVKNGHLIRIKRDDDDFFFGTVIDVAPGEYTTKVSFKPFIAIFDINVLFDTNDQLQNDVTHSLENTLKKYIEAYFKSNSDTIQNYPIDVIVPSSDSDHTTSWGMNIKSDTEGMHKAIIGLYTVLIVNALKKFGVAINAAPNFNTGRIELTIGKIDGVKNIDGDLDNVEVSTLKVNDRPNGINKLVIYNTETYADNDTYTFYVYTTHDWGIDNENRILPVAPEIRAVTPDSDVDPSIAFYVAALSCAYDELSGLTWDNLIELECAPNDPLVNPVSMKIGQEVALLYKGNTYNSILTGKAVSFENVKLSFGSERIKFTKKRISK